MYYAAQCGQATAIFDLRQVFDLRQIFDLKTELNNFDLPSWCKYDVHLLAKGVRTASPSCQLPRRSDEGGVRCRDTAPRADYKNSCPSCHGKSCPRSVEREASRPRRQGSLLLDVGGAEAWGIEVLGHIWDHLEPSYG